VDLERIQIQGLCGSGAVLGIWILEPDPGARKLLGKLSFLVIFFKFSKLHAIK
jgi:hypothetical protein